MALFWFLLALVLLVAALVILRLDAKQRGGGSRGSRPEVDDGREWEPAEVCAGGVVGADLAAGGDDFDDAEGPHRPEPAGAPDSVAESAGAAAVPELAPFQRGAGAEKSDRAGAGAPPAQGPGSGSADGAGAAAAADTEPVAAGPAATTSADADADAVADDEALSAAAAGAQPGRAVEGSAELAPLDLSEPAVESSPRLLDRVRALLPARRGNGAAVDQAGPDPVDPLAGSPVVRWLEDREFAPTPTPAPEFLHGDFAGGLSALGTVSHGVFRGRRAIMGVTGGRTVLALRRDTASDVVLDLSRPDVDAEPGFHDAGEIGALEARTSDYGRLDLIDRDRLAGAVEDVPAHVRRIWAEGEWVAATIDGVDDPSGWDDVVMALHGAADVVAPFPPIGGRARALPAEMDPGAPAAAEGPEADPTTGMDGEVGTGTHGIAPLPDPEDHVVVDTPATPGAAATIPVPGSAPSDSTVPAPAGHSGAQSKRGGHLRLVPDRPAARDLSDVPVVADRGDATDAPDTSADAPASPAPTADGDAQAGSTSTDGVDVAATTEDPVVEESDPFAEIMEPEGPISARGDVAADHLAPRPPLSRPTRGAGQAYPEDATVPPLAAGVASGGAVIKPLGSEDDEDELRDEVERFDAARIDGRSDFDQPSAGRHGEPGSGSGGRHGAHDVDPSEVTQRLSVAELAARMGVDPAEMRSPGRRRRRAAEDPDERAQGKERPGIEPDVEQTARLDLPPDIRD